MKKIETLFLFLIIKKPRIILESFKSKQAAAADFVVVQITSL